MEASSLDMLSDAESLPSDAESTEMDTTTPGTLDTLGLPDSDPQVSFGDVGRMSQQLSLPGGDFRLSWFFDFRIRCPICGELLDDIVRGTPVWESGRVDRVVITFSHFENQSCCSCACSYSISEQRIDWERCRQASRLSQASKRKLGDGPWCREMEQPGCPAGWLPYMDQRSKRFYSGCHEMDAVARLG